MRRLLISVGLAWLLSWTPVGTVRAVEPWADAALKVREGLEIWLDASVQQAARAAIGAEPLEIDAPTGVAYDAARKYGFTHVAVSKSPTFHTQDDVAYFRFRGIDQHLEADLRSGEEGPGLEFDEISVFVVAAPFHNDGGFQGMLALHTLGEADYRTGLNIDLGPSSTPRFSAVNVEGAGSSGGKNLRTGRGDFSKFHRLCVTSRVGKGGVVLYVNGKREGQRERAAGTLKADRMILGGRYTGDDRGVRCFFAGDIAEVLVYDRVLSDDQRKQVDAYLAAKYDSVDRLPLPAELAGSRWLVAVQSPPPVQMHVPGFTVRELPVELPNINNVLYREDGVLVALAYDGNIYLLRDTDGDD
ncbi:MAG TPA: LamG-like jellyroll fold domain-containing protein, partial [Lacipirellula sp.]